MRRAVLALLLFVGLVPGTFLLERGEPWNDAFSLHFEPLKLPPRAERAASLGPFDLVGAWAMQSPYSGFGGYSALVPLPGERLMAISDSGRVLTFSPPGAPQLAPERGTVLPEARRRKFDVDVEAATRDPATGTIWLAREYLNAISRHDPQFHTMVNQQPPAMRQWGDNSGPEALTRLADGRFLVLCEGFTGTFEWREHAALLFPGDPVKGVAPLRFTFDGSTGYSPTDMAQLPDGRVLILMRRLAWPLPLRFAGRILIADPATIRPGAVWRTREVAKLEAPLPVDNFEGLAIVPRADGKVTVWLISDKNAAATQRTLLWKLVLDPARLPPMRKRQARKKARD
ncbi:esterase-like activity of phytase family protein [Novosphingobium sp. PS1R-30]|uniref:Esterase-like activity of phytase family protein n=1 Tax=Novosphingobium anseongense TaxID=3133436 RepID=A0ABU8RVY8_9SPHN